MFVKDALSLIRIGMVIGASAGLPSDVVFALLAPVFEVAALVAGYLQAPRVTKIAPFEEMRSGD